MTEIHVLLKGSASKERQKWFMGEYLPQTKIKNVGHIHHSSFS